MSESPNLLLEEWKETRNVLKIFDDRTHDLRKYGFTLITALLAIQGLLLPFVPAGPPSEIKTVTELVNGTNNELITREIQTVTDPTKAPGTPSGLPYVVKIAILAVTAILVIALRWLDGHYQGFQHGAALRAKVIERFLNLEVTDALSLRYNTDRLQQHILVLYFGFEVALIVMAYFLLPNFENLSATPDIGFELQLLFTLIASLAAEGAFYIIFSSPTRLRDPLKTEWATDKIQCKQGDYVRLMMTHIRPGVRTLAESQIIWKIYDSAGNTPDDPEVQRGTMQESVQVRQGDCYIWTFKAKLPPGLYGIRVDMDEEGTELLNKRGRLHKLAHDLNNKFREHLGWQVEPDYSEGRVLNRRLLVLPAEEKKGPDPNIWLGVIFRPG